MKIDIIWQRSGSDKEVSNHLTRQIRLALGRFGSSIQTAAIYIPNVSDRQDRVSVKCIVTMKMMLTDDIVLHERGENVFSALNHCLSRASRTISRLLERSRNTPNRISSPNTTYTRRVR
jgi:enamine deaminase RidA (YjgF/YER057c/UK114 family)